MKISLFYTLLNMASLTLLPKIYSESGRKTIYEIQRIFQISLKLRRFSKEEEMKNTSLIGLGGKRAITLLSFTSDPN